jgi:hypothetical protein
VLHPGLPEKPKLSELNTLILKLWIPAVLNFLLIPLVRAQPPPRRARGRPRRMRGCVRLENSTGALQDRKASGRTQLDVWPFPREGELPGAGGAHTPGTLSQLVSRTLLLNRRALSQLVSRTLLLNRRALSQLVSRTLLLNRRALSQLVSRTLLLNRRALSQLVVFAGGGCGRLLGGAHGRHRGAGRAGEISPRPIPPSGDLRHCQADERCSDGVEDQGAEDVLWGMKKSRIDQVSFGKSRLTRAALPFSEDIVNSKGLVKPSCWLVLLNSQVAWELKTGRTNR